MAKHFQRSQEPNEEDRQVKKAKKRHSDQDGGKQAQLIQLMAAMIIRMDYETQQLRKQDSYVFFMQMEADGVVHDLMKKGKEWHHHMQNGTQMATEEQKPLRVALMQTLVTTLSTRLTELSKSQTSNLYQAAVQTNVITTTGDFLFHRWDHTQQKLSTTDQAPIPMARMLRYVQQMEEIFKDWEVTLKFKSLKAQPGTSITLGWYSWV